MATTTNFGWETPDDTDLVKDGALAMRTLGNSIDSSFVDLKGGTTGQILSKASNTDLDYTWINNDQGDITAVTAGTGLTGGGTTGAVTVSLDSPVAATLGGTAQTTYTTGDLLYASGTNTLAKRAIGTSGQVLTVSGGVPTWASPASGSTFSGALVFNDAQQTISNNTDTYLTYNSETYDTDGYHSTSTNTGRLTIPTGKDGYYYVSSIVRWNNNTTGLRTMQITQGTGQSAVTVIEATPGGASAYIGYHAATIRYAAAGDFFECKVNQTSGGNLNVRAGSAECGFTIQYLGA